jgi:hypothetical protein
MKYLLCIVCILVFLCPRVVHAERDMYYARHRSSRTGSEVTRFIAAASFLHDRLYREPVLRPQYFCSLSRLLPEDRGAAMLADIAETLSSVLKMDSQEIRVSIMKAHCSIPVSPRTVRLEQKQLRMDSRGRVLSSNAVWNACIRGENLTPAFLRSNSDAFIHRQGRVRVRIPLSCRDYHRGDLRVWQFPDDASVELVLDTHGKLLGDAPPDYYLVTP